MTTQFLFRANLAHFPHASESPDTVLHSVHDGALVIQDDKILAVGQYAELAGQYPEAQVRDFKDHWIVPGLIDSHLHYPQTEMIACYGKQLLQTNPLTTMCTCCRWTRQH